MSLEQQVADLVTATTELTTAVNLKKSELDDSSEAAVRAAAEAVPAAAEAVASAAAAATSESNAAAIVTGGTGSITPEAGKLPIAGGDGTILGDWLEEGYIHSKVAEMIPLGDSVVYDKASDETVRISSAMGLGAQKAMRRCVLSDAGEVVYYLDENDSTLQEDGSTPAVLDGTDGQVMVEIPLTYVKAVDFGTSYQWATSLLPLPGFVVHPAFTEGGTFEYNEAAGTFHYANPTRVANYIYVGAYQASVYSSGTYIDGLNLDDNTARVTVGSDKLASVAGKYPMVGLTRDEFRTLASNRGEDWGQLDFWTQSLLQILFFVEYADLNSQRALGAGNTSISGGYPASSDLQTDSLHSRAGKSDKVGNLSGSVESSDRDTAWVSYRGIENWFGNAWQWTDGININNRAWYASNTPPYSDDTSSGYVLLGTAPSENGYTTAIHSNIPGVVPLSTAGGSSSSAFGDTYYQSTGWRILRVGGFASSGTDAGACCWHASNSAGSRSRSISARLLFKKF